VGENLSLAVEYQGGTKTPKVATYRYSRKGMVQILCPFGCRTHRVADVDLESLLFGSQKAGLSFATKSRQDFKLGRSNRYLLKMSEEPYFRHPNKQKDLPNQAFIVMNLMSSPGLSHNRAELSRIIPRTWHVNVEVKENR
jgi:hypothetical protein